MPPRDGLRERMAGYPAVGAVHPVVQNRDLLNLFYAEGSQNSIVEVLDDFFDPPNYFDTRSLEEKDNDGVQRYNSAHFYRLFDPQTLGVSVMEMDITAQAAKRQRSVWEGKDMGRVKQEVLDLAARRSPNNQLVIKLGNVMPVGGKLPGKYKDDPPRQKLAFFPDIYDEQTYQTLELLYAEHDIIRAAIENRLRANRHTKVVADLIAYSYIPHITFLSYKRDVGPKKVIEANRRLSALVAEKPITVELERLNLDRSRLVR